MNGSDRKFAPCGKYKTRGRHNGPDRKLRFTPCGKFRPGSCLENLPQGIIGKDARKSGCEVLHVTACIVYTYCVHCTLYTKGKGEIKHIDKCKKNSKGKCSNKQCHGQCFGQN